MGLSVVSPVVVGRADELRLLDGHARRVRSGTAATLLLGGEAGIGKSRLLEEFTARTTNGIVVAGGCLELGADGLPLAPFVTVLRRLRRDLGPDRFAELWGPGGPGELARLLPELGAAPPDERPEARGRLFGQVLRVLSAAAEPAGLTVILEDLHWADSATRHLLVFLVRNLDTARVQLVAAFRTDDLHRDHPLRRLLPELERLPAVTRMDLRPLSREQVAEQAQAILGGDIEPADLAFLYERTAGNPLFVESLLELPDSQRHTLPERPRELLLGPLRGLGEDARAVATAASVGGRGGQGVEHRLLAEAARLEDDRLEAALRALVDANLLRVEGSGYRFRHALLREAVHAELLPGRRSRLHLDYAAALERDPGGAAGHAAELAHHYYEAHEQPRALSAAWRAAERARAAYGYDEQLHMAERVIDLWDRVPDAEERVGMRLVDVVERAAEAAIDSGATERGLDLAEAGLRALPGAGDEATATRRALLLRRRGQARRDLNDPGALDDIRESARVLPPGSPHRPSVLATLAGELALRTHFGEAAEVARAAVAEARAALRDRPARPSADLSTPCPQEPWPHVLSELHARITLATLEAQDGRPDAALRELDACSAGARRADDPETETRAIGHRIGVLWESGRSSQAVEDGRAALDRVRDLGTMGSCGSFVAVNLVEALYYSGGYAECRETAGRALARGPMLLHRLNLYTRRGLAALAMGDTDAARADRGRQRLSGEAPHAHTQDELPAALLDLELSLADGDIAAAVATASAAVGAPRFATWPAYAWHVLEAAARAVRAGEAAGGGGDIARLRADAAAVCGVMAVSGPAQTALRETVRAHLAEGGDGPADAAGRAWRTAVAAWRRADEPCMLAAALLRLAESDAEQGDRAAAAAVLPEAAAIAERAGARPLLGRTADLARRMGAALGAEGGAVPPAPQGLTPREAEVLRLLAQGRTNAQIAERLFISAKTASVHVSNILAKLDVPNRASAGARARGLGLG
ncbi:AAA family ATPase [Nocardiopsis mangrovi]|uniref:AAA family ATPase n=1 Tax=Nocardiopsis mangrovi TaxID=1179818 RepID=A0ABV9E3L7_9ACTN